MNKKASPNKIKPGLQYIDMEEVRVPGIKKVILTGDVGCTGFYEDSKEIFGQILSQKTDAFFVLGDLAFTGAEEEFHEIIDFCNSRVQVPIFALCGNHDVLNYDKFLGLSSYVIILNNLACIFLNNATGYFLDVEIDFLKKALEKYEEKDLMLFMHVPPPTDIDRNHLLQEDWEKLKKVIDRHKSKIKRIFCAHIHGFHDYYLDGYRITITAGGGGAMINDLKKPEQKLYQSIIMTLHENGEVTTEVITFKNPT